MKICIDAGHTKDYKTYNTNPVKYEGTQMYYLSLYEKAELEKYENVSVTLTREQLTDNPSLTDRGKMAKDYDLLISNHSNAAGDANIKGVICYMDCTEKNSVLADSLGNAIAQAFNSPYRGRRYWIQTYKDGKLTPNGAVYEVPKDGASNWLTVLKSAKANNCKMAFLMEQGYHSNKENAAMLGDLDFLKKLAKIKIGIIAKHYSLKLKVAPPEESGGDDTSGGYTGSYISYTVVKGDNLSKIAVKFDTTVYEIAKINQIKNVNIIYVGQVLKISQKGGEYQPKVGDKVLVSGLLYSNAGGGSTISKSNTEMYIVDVLSEKSYKFPIGFAKSKGGTRQGWGNLGNIVIRHV